MMKKLSLFLVFYSVHAFAMDQISHAIRFSNPQQVAGLLYFGPAITEQKLNKYRSIANDVVQMRCIELTRGTRVTYRNAQKAGVVCMSAMALSLISTVGACVMSKYGIFNAIFYDKFAEYSCACFLASYFATSACIETELDAAYRDAMLVKEVLLDFKFSNTAAGVPALIEQQE